MPRRKKDLDELLEEWTVYGPGLRENDATPSLPLWYAVANDDGIVAYFRNETSAFRWRLAMINRKLNP